MKVSKRKIYEKSGIESLINTCRFTQHKSVFARWDTFHDNCPLTKVLEAYDQIKTVYSREN